MRSCSNRISGIGHYIANAKLFKLSGIGHHTANAKLFKLSGSGHYTAKAKLFKLNQRHWPLFTTYKIDTMHKQAALAAIHNLHKLYDAVKCSAMQCIEVHCRERKGGNRW